MRTKLQPYVYPFRRTLIDEYGMPSGISWIQWSWERVTPGVALCFDRYPKGRRKLYTLACASRELQCDSLHKPQYIGRGMIRLYERSDLEEDTIVDLNLVPIDSPDRSFGGVEYADFIWDDESFALVVADRDSSGSVLDIQDFYSLFPDGHVSNIRVNLPLHMVNPSHARPIILRNASARRGAYLVDQDAMVERINFNFYSGQSADVLITSHRRDGLSVFNRELEQIGRFESGKSPFLTPENRVISFEKYYGEGIRVQSIRGEELARYPDMKLFGRRIQSPGWYIGSRVDGRYSLFDAKFDLRATLPEGCRVPSASPDGYVFTCAGRGSHMGANPKDRLFRCYSPDGDLVQAFSMQTPEEREQMDQQRHDLESAQQDRRELKRIPRVIVQIETLYAANTPTSSKDIQYQRIPIGAGSEDYPSPIIIVPLIDGKQCCPVCGLSMDGYPIYGPDGEESDDLICPNCKFQPGCDNCGCDDPLDAQFGGQFGAYRKQWLDKTGWQSEDLDRIESVFQLETEGWPRDEGISTKAQRFERS